VSDIPGLTIGKFVVYFFPVAATYLVLWVVLSWLGLKKRKSTGYWLLLVIFAVIAPYLAYLPFYRTPYMYGDSFYYFSYVKSIADGNFLKDVCYSGYPTYYPPLYFLFLGFLMWFFKTSWVNFFILIPIFNILLICTLMYLVGRYIVGKKAGVLFILMFFIFSVPAVGYFVKEMRESFGLHFAVTQPHEAIAAILLIFGIFVFSREKKQDVWWAGFIGGVITLLSINYAVYYFLSILVYAITRAIKTHQYKLHFLRIFIAMSVAFLVSSIYIIPYFLSILSYGADNYHWKWSILSNFDPYLVTFGLGFMGFTFVMGIVGIIALPKSNFRLMLIVTLIVLLFGRFHIYITKPFFNISYISDHAYYAIASFLSFTSALFLTNFPIKIHFKKCVLQELSIAHIFLFATFFLPIFTWNPIGINHLYQAFMPITEQIEKIGNVISEKTAKNEVILSSNGISPWILLLTGRHLALSSDPWCSNPAARYSLRYKDFSEMFSAYDVMMVKDRLKKWKVDIIVFVKEDDKWIFKATSPEFGKVSSGVGLRAIVNKDIFDNKSHFAKLYEDKYYVVLRND
jgi:hypothetical protein